MIKRGNWPTKKNVLQRSEMKFEVKEHGITEEIAGCGNADSVIIQEALEKPEELSEDISFANILSHSFFSQKSFSEARELQTFAQCKK